MSSTGRLLAVACLAVALTSCADDDCVLESSISGDGSTQTDVTAIMRCGQSGNEREGELVRFVARSAPGCPCLPSTECAMCTPEENTVCVPPPGCDDAATCPEPVTCTAETTTDAAGRAVASLVFRNPNPGESIQVGLRIESDVATATGLVIDLASSTPTPTPTVTGTPTLTPTVTPTPTPTSILPF